MSDEQTGDQIPQDAVDHPEAGQDAAGERPSPRPVRRPRPAPSPSYVPGRRSRGDDGGGINPLIVPIFAVVALLALVAAVVFDRVRTAAAPGPTPTLTLAPLPTVPTPVPTATPVVLPPPSTSKAGVAAEVNGQVVAMNVFAQVIKADGTRMQQASQDPTTGAPIAAVNLGTPAGMKLYNQHVRADLNNLIDSAVIDSYASAHNLAATKAQVDKVLNSYYQQAGGQAAFTKQVQTQGYTMDVVNTFVYDQATGQNVFTAITKNAPCPCELHARHILLKAKDSALAITLAKELQANKGATFAALAKKYSTDTGSAKLGGDLSWFGKGQMVPPFEKAAFALKINQVSDPVKSQFGWHIIQVLGTRPSGVSTQAVFKKWQVAERAKAAIHTYVNLPKA